MISDTQKVLEKELEKLKRTSGHGHELFVRWMPSEKPISGEIKSNIIYVYDFDENISIDTLYHEFIEYLVVKTIEPYRLLANKLMEMFNENAYSIKEGTIEGISKLISDYKINRHDKILSRR